MKKEEKKIIFVHRVHRWLQTSTDFWSEKDEEGREETTWFLMRKGRAPSTFISP
jgi:hypothetical protein